MIQALRLHTTSYLRVLEFSTMAINVGYMMGEVIGWLFCLQATSVFLLAIITVPALHHLHYCVIIEQVQLDVTVMS